MYRQLMTSFFVPLKKAKKNGAGEGNRTLATSLEGWGSTIELHPQNKKWSEQQDSNLRPPGPKPGALPNCAMPRHSLLCHYSKPGS